MIDFFLERYKEIFELTIEHLNITMLSLCLTLLIAIPLGIFLTRKQKIAQSVIGVVGMIQTIPSLALLGFLIPFLGIGKLPSILALMLYSLLPVVQNTYVGICEVEEGVVEAAKGIGMNSNQRLFKVELPLALPVIFAGIRTATVLNVGVATICALIGAGGLGSLIFRGINLNNSNMILAGAIPAAGLALALDFLLKVLEKDPLRWIKRYLVLGILGLVLIQIGNLRNEPEGKTLIAGFPSEFVERADGYHEFSKTYDLEFDVKEMDSALMYSAVKEGKVDLISGYSTDGRIRAFDLVSLTDDKNFFPPYHAAFLFREDILKKYPILKNVLAPIEGQISDEIMTNLNYEVDFKKRPVRDVAKEYLASIGIPTGEKRSGEPDLVIAWKSFTEQYILAEIFAFLVEAKTELVVELKSPLAGTKIALEALKRGDIHVYPDYTGTGLMVHLNLNDPKKVKTLIRSPEKVYEFVKNESFNKFGIIWGKPLGFNNTYAIMMRRDTREKLGLKTISDLSDSLK